MTAVAQTFLVVSPLPWRQSHVNNKYGFLSPAGPVLVWLSVSLPVRSLFVGAWMYSGTGGC